MKRYRSILLAFAVAAGAAVAAAPAQAAEPTHCTASFHVLHDDRVGSLQLPHGAYQLRTNELTCTKASALFAQFLQDYNGVLPKPWRYSAQGTGQGTFTRTSRQYFTAVRTGDASTAAPGPASAGGGSHGDLLCPGSFDVLHNDRVGRLSVPKGPYLITLLGGSLSCGTADRLFARFLDRPDGRLGGGWVVLPASGEFVNGSSHRGFRIKSVNQIG